MGTSEPLVYNLSPHEPTAACQPVHCYSCGVDEPGEGYIVCWECGHVYQTAKDLRRAYRRKEKEMRGGAAWRLLPLIFSTNLEPSRLWIVWHSLTVRAKDIYFCQECSHDF